MSAAGARLRENPLLAKWLLAIILATGMPEISQQDGERFGTMREYDQMTMWNNVTGSVVVRLYLILLNKGNDKGNENMVVFPYSYRSKVFSRDPEKLVMKSLGTEFHLGEFKVKYQGRWQAKALTMQIVSSFFVGLIIGVFWWAVGFCTSNVNDNPNDRFGAWMAPFRAKYGIL
jgi:hypothetical protein